MVTRRAAGGRPAVRRARHVLPARAVRRPGAHAGLPHARVRARRHARQRARVPRRVARQRSQQMLGDLGLQVVPTSRTIRSSAGSARCSPRTNASSALKFELLATVSSEEQPTAIASCNCHLDHLTVTFGISAAGGAQAHSACVGFGLERIVLALFADARPRSRPLARTTCASGSGNDPSAAHRRVDLPAERVARRRPRLGRDQLLHRSLDRVAARAGTRLARPRSRSRFRSTSKVTSGSSSSSPPRTSGSSTASKWRR